MTFQDFLLLQSAANAVASKTEAGTSDPASPLAGKSGNGQGNGNSAFGSGVIWLLLPLLLLLMFSMGGGNRKKQKEMQAMLAALEKGDKIQTIGGIVGTVVHVKEGSVVVKVDDNTKIEFAVNAVQSVLVKKNPVPEAPKKGFLASLKDKIGGKKAAKSSEKASAADATPESTAARVDSEPVDTESASPSGPDQE